jgi:choline dehydrogenase
MNVKQYDYIIVGGGSAGCVLANRLSENPDNQVLVLEAGRPDYSWDLFIHMPAALTYPIGSSLYDWKYESEPEPFMGDRKIYHARGKLLGGSSSINGMIFQRGNPMDYERWASDEGMESWDHAHCLPYFKKMENCLAGKDEFRGGEGPLILERGPIQNPLFSAFLKATVEAGYPSTADVNGFKQEGFAKFDRNILNGKRLSSARAYYHPIKDRTNLTLVTRALASKIIFEGNRAVGVNYFKGRSSQRAMSGEVILCGGAFNTPQLLQMSGVGEAEHLKGLDIPVVAENSAVGENMQDHLEVYVQHACKKPITLNPELKWYNKPSAGIKWLTKKKGPASTNHFEAGGFVRSNDDVKYPNLMFHFLPLAVRYDGSQPEAEHGYQVHVGPMYSDAVGTVKISSTDPRKHPKLRFNYLSTAQDRREWVEAIQVSRKIMSQSAFDDFNAGELSPGSNIESDEDILDWVGRDAETALHPSCTARMGVGSNSAICPLTMKPHGTEGLRVVDASSMPYITNGNIYAPIMMLAEKASDLILGNTPLAAEPLEFYRHSN